MNAKSLPRNPDFDDDRVIWNDEYSGIYQPVSYSDQFDEQWRLYLERKIGFCDHTGAETSYEYIDDRIFEITGIKNYLLSQKWGALTPLVSILSGREKRRERRKVGGVDHFDLRFSIDFFRGKKCLDIACGAGRWTKTLTSLGANVFSIDASGHALKSTMRFTPTIEKLDLFEIPERSDLCGVFDFVLAWGVLMHTHDPKKAFESAAKAVKPGGAFYFCVYAPHYHASDFVRSSRRKYHKELLLPAERLAYAYELTDGKPEMAISYLDMLNTFYNWTIPEEIIFKWCADNGFSEPIIINRSDAGRCHHHTLTWRKAL